MSLSLKNISKRYDSKIIFENFSYNFSETGVYAIVGESGTGKTTLLRIICGLDTKAEGEIIGGGIINTSFAFQEYRLFPHLSAIQNIVAANGESDDAELTENARKLLMRLGFTDSELNLLPSELSGGMKQRVSLVRAFLRKTPILLLDEPTKELDEKIRETLYDMINEEGKKRLVIIVSHHMEDFEKLDAVKIYI